MWAAQRSGLYGVCLSSRLTAAEIAYIVEDSGATAIVTSHAFAPLVAGLAPTILYVEDDPAAGFPDTPIADERAGTDMLYSSGTTGHPKGIRLTLPEDGAIDTARSALEQLAGRLGIGPATVYLGPSAALSCRAAALVDDGAAAGRHGRADGEVRSLPPRWRSIERYRVTHSQWVPDAFRPPAETATRRPRAPRPVVAETRDPRRRAVPGADQAGDDRLVGAGVAGILCRDGGQRADDDRIGGVADASRIGRARDHRPAGDLRRGRASRFPQGTDGLVHFADGPAFSYHNDPDKTAAARNRHGWTTLGDIGHVDGDGYLYLTDRQSFMIISGGVNIYPQEIENLLVTHPAVTGRRGHRRARSGDGRARRRGRPAGRLERKPAMRWRGP